jgi:hypothetical protein
MSSSITTWHNCHPSRSTNHTSISLHLSQHYSGRVGVAASYCGHARCVYDTQALNAFDAAQGINYT